MAHARRIAQGVLNGHLYLCDIVGTGTEADPFRPPIPGGVIAPWLDLRPDHSMSAGYGLVFSPVPITDSRMRLFAADAGENLATVSRTMIGNRLSLTLGMAQPSVSEMLRELLEDHATTDGTRWKPLRSQVNGEVAIHMGGQQMFSRQDAPRSHSQNYTETFPTTGTSAAQVVTWVTESATWNIVAGTPNVCRANAAGGSTALYRTPALDSDDHAITGTFDLTSAAENNITVLRVRRSTTVDTDYRAQAQRNSGGHLRILRARVSGTNTTLASDTTDPGASGTQLCSADGSSIRGVVGSFDQTVTDTGITGNLPVGIGVFAASTVSRAQLRGDLNIYDIVAAATYGFNVFDGGIFDGRVLA